MISVLFILLLYRSLPVNDRKSKIKTLLFMYNRIEEEAKWEILSGLGIKWILWFDFILLGKPKLSMHFLIKFIFGWISLVHALRCVVSLQGWKSRWPYHGHAIWHACSWVMGGWWCDAGWIFLFLSSYPGYWGHHGKFGQQSFFWQYEHCHQIHQNLYSSGTLLWWWEVKMKTACKQTRVALLFIDVGLFPFFTMFGVKI